MPITSTNLRSPDSGGYACNGSLTAFTGDFPLLAESDAKVVLTDSSGNESTLILTTEYTVAPTGGSYPCDTFTINTVATYASGFTITILQDIAATQPTSYGNQGPYLPKNHQTSFDRSTLQIQKIQEQVNRAVKVPAGSTLDPDSIYSDFSDGTLTAVAYTSEKLLSNYSSLSDAISSIGATETQLIVDTDDTLSGDVTLPSGTLTLRFVQGSTIDGPHTLDINGCNIIAGNYQLFGSSVTVTGIDGNGDSVPQWWGAVADGVTDDTDAIQSAVDAAHRVRIPQGTYKVTSVVLKYHTNIFGDGMDSTRIVPTSGSNAFIMSSDFIHVSDLSFYDPDIGMSEDAATITSSCIYTDAVSYNAGFTRAIQGCKIERVLFINIKGPAIHIDQSMRESIIRENRFFGMGNPSTGVGVVYCKETIGSGTNINNLWIRDNEWYRFATPCLDFRASTVLATSVPSYADIHISGNLIHNQRLETSVNLQPVESEDTDTTYFENITDMYINNNKFTSVHPDYSGLKIVNNASYEMRHIAINGNRFTPDTGRADLTYPGTGNMVHISETRALALFGNGFRANSADRHAKDVYVVRTNVNPISVGIGMNTIVNGDLIFDIDTWEGVFDLQGVNQGDVKFLGKLNLTARTEIDIIADSVQLVPKGGMWISMNATTGTDNLDNIIGTDREEGDTVIISPASGDTVTVKDGIGNIRCAGDFIMDSPDDTMTLIYDGTNWLELSRSDNS